MFNFLQTVCVYIHPNNQIGITLNQIEKPACKHLNWSQSELNFNRIGRSGVDLTM